MIVEIEARRLLGGRKTPFWVNTDKIEYIDPETVTIGLASGKVIDTTESSCEQLILFWNTYQRKV